MVDHRHDDGCASGVCGADVPPLVGSVLTGSGLTLRQAARALAAGETPALSDVQRRLVERWVESEGHDALRAGSSPS